MISKQEALKVNKEGENIICFPAKEYGLYLFGYKGIARTKIWKELQEIKPMLDNNRCDVCNGDDEYPDNIIVKCAACKIRVHQYCYGSELIQKISDPIWHCVRCQYCMINIVSPTTLKYLSFNV